MADEPQKVIVQASRVDDSMLPSVFSLAYRLYVIQQSGDLKNVADASNNANDLAYQATVKNEEQDQTLASHEQRITTSEQKIASIEGRLTSVETTVSSLSSDVVNVKARLTTAEASITDLQNNKASKTESLLKSGNLSGLANVSTARSNLGLGDAAVKNTGTSSGTVAAGDDSRFGTVNGKSGGTITSDVTVSGKVTSTGTVCRRGLSGTPSGNVFNLYWTGGAAELWIDGSRIGTINTTG